MNKEELVLYLIDKLLNSNTTSETSIKKEEEMESVFIGKYIILRCKNAGIHFGKLEYAKNGVYRLSESRRLYRWRIKNKNGISLSELSLYGLDEEYSKINETIKLIEITERNGGELIPVENQDIIYNFKNFKTYNPN